VAAGALSRAYRPISTKVPPSQNGMRQAKSTRLSLKAALTMANTAAPKNAADTDAHAGEATP
jgi:hypothetical protein